MHTHTDIKTAYIVRYRISTVTIRRVTGTNRTDVNGDRLMAFSRRTPRRYQNKYASER